VDGNDQNMPEQGKYNGGQKAMFWASVVCMVLLLVSGVLIWRAQFSSPLELVRFGAVVHAVAGAAMIALIMIHVYAAIWVKGNHPRHVVRHGHPAPGRASTTAPGTAR
jgi:formate dehydrogenase subunit gamma